MMKIHSRHGAAMAMPVYLCLLILYRQENLISDQMVNVRFSKFSLVSYHPNIMRAKVLDM